MYQLKKGEESFRIVDGPGAGLDFVRGKVYAGIPEGYANRFEAVPEAAAPADPAQPARKTGKKED